MTERIEKKYILEIGDSVEVKSSLLPFLKPDMHRGAGSDSYLINSIYFDDINLTNYWDKVNGLSVRSKVRLRWYGAEKPRYCFLEIKSRDYAKTGKVRYKVEINGGSRDVIEMVLGDSKIPPLFKASVRAGTVRPVVGVSYLRSAYVCKQDPTFRITWDRDIRFDIYRKGPFLHPPVSVSPVSFSILELKARKTIPAIILDVIQNYSLKQISVSKYALAVEYAVSKFGCL